MTQQHLLCALFDHLIFNKTCLVPKSFVWLNNRTLYGNWRNLALISIIPDLLTKFHMTYPFLFFICLKRWWSFSTSNYHRNTCFLNYSWCNFPCTVFIITKIQTTCQNCACRGTFGVFWGYWWIKKWYHTHYRNSRIFI